MPSSDTEKIVSGRKFLGIVQDSLSLVVLASLTLAGFGIFVGHLPHQKIWVGQSQYDVEFAMTPAARHDGLSGRTTLAPDKGMLFAFDRSDKVCMWMRDMHFPLDIIWLDHHKKVTHIEHDVSPETYPNDFCPPDPAQFVIELNAGQADRAKLHTGDQLSF